jgi:hypothetical protein
MFRGKEKLQMTLCLEVIISPFTKRMKVERKISLGKKSRYLFEHIKFEILIMQK